MLGLFSSRALSLFSNSTALNSFRDKLYPIATRALSHIPRPTPSQIRYATPLLLIGLLYLIQKLCYSALLKLEIVPRLSKAGAASGSADEPEISAEEITNLWSKIRLKLGNLYRLMRSKNAIDLSSFQETENTLSLAIKQKATTYKASLKQELNSFLAKIEERTRALSGQSGVTVAD